MRKLLFCANCQKETEQDFALVNNAAELVATCACGRQLKWPGSLTAGELAEALAAHAAHNVGQVKALTEEELASHPLMKHLGTL